jgi:hypothetical protein
MNYDFLYMCANRDDQSTVRGRTETVASLYDERELIKPHSHTYWSESAEGNQSRTSTSDVLFVLQVTDFYKLPILSICNN